MLFFNFLSPLNGRRSQEGANKTVFKYFENFLKIQMYTSCFFSFESELLTLLARNNNQVSANQYTNYC